MGKALQVRTSSDHLFIQNNTHDMRDARASCYTRSRLHTATVSLDYTYQFACACVRCARILSTGRCAHIHCISESILRARLALTFHLEQHRRRTSYIRFFLFCPQSFTSLLLFTMLVLFVSGTKAMGLARNWAARYSLSLIRYVYVNMYLLVFG